MLSEQRNPQKRQRRQQQQRKWWRKLHPFTSSTDEVMFQLTIIVFFTLLLSLSSLENQLGKGNGQESSFRQAMYLFVPETDAFSFHSVKSMRQYTRVIAAAAVEDPPSQGKSSSDGDKGTQKRKPTLRRLHDVNGIECVEVTVNSLQRFLDCPVTILEATSASQETLVNLALLEEGDDGYEEQQKQQSSVSLSHADPYGAVLWPAAAAVAAHLLQNKDRLLDGKHVVEVGTGTGLVALAVAMSGAPLTVLATDYEVLPLQLLEYSAKQLNNNLSQSSPTTLNTELFDICDSSQSLPRPEPHQRQVSSGSPLRTISSIGSSVSTATASKGEVTGEQEKDVGVILVAADVMYEPGTGRAMARRVVEALEAGMQVVIGDSPGRAGRPAFLHELRSLLLHSAEHDDGSTTIASSASGIDFVNTIASTVTGERHELICGDNSPTVSKDDVPHDLIVAIMELSPEDETIQKLLLRRDQHKRLGS